MKSRKCRMRLAAFKILCPTPGCLQITEKEEDRQVSVWRALAE